MTKPTAAHLKLHVEPLPSFPAPTDEAVFPALCEAFERATGWRLSFDAGDCEVAAWSAPIDGGNGATRGRLTLSPSRAPRPEPESSAKTPPSKSPPPKAPSPKAPARPSVSLESARPLALAIGGLLAEMNRLRHALCEREAELAANVPITARPNEEAHLAERLQAVLKGGADAVGAQAAALYLLDDATTSLKLRASFGLPSSRLLDAPRPLRGAVADLEALVGHAVVLEDTSLLPHWKSPENFPAAVCVPVSSSTAPLGTLWIFSDSVRDFSDEQTNLIEIVAGRIAADLEREMLIATGTELKQLDKEINRAARWQHDRLPSVVPLIDQLDIAGWTEQAEGIGGDFHDWSVLPDSRLAIAVGDAHGKLVEAAMNAASLHASLKSHAGYRHDAVQMLQRMNDTLWTASAGDQYASLAYGILHPDSTAVELALAGQVAAILVQEGKHQILTTDLPPLGVNPDLRYRPLNFRLEAEDFLLLISTGARSAVDEAGLHIGEAAIASLVERHRRESASGMVAHVRRLLDRTGGPLVDDMTVLVVKRRG